jgi:hypothetical protein
MKGGTVQRVVERIRNSAFPGLQKKAALGLDRGLTTVEFEVSKFTSHTSVLLKEIHLHTSFCLRYSTVRNIITAVSLFRFRQDNLHLLFPFFFLFTFLDRKVARETVVLFELPRTTHEGSLDDADCHSKSGPTDAWTNKVAGFQLLFKLCSMRILAGRHMDEVSHGFFPWS